MKLFNTLIQHFFQSPHVLLNQLAGQTEAFEDLSHTLRRLERRFRYLSVDWQESQPIPRTWLIQDRMTPSVSFSQPLIERVFSSPDVFVLAQPYLPKTFSIEQQERLSVLAVTHANVAALKYLIQHQQLHGCTLTTSPSTREIHPTYIIRSCFTQNIFVRDFDHEMRDYSYQKFPMPEGSGLVEYACKLIDRRAWMACEPEIYARRESWNNPESIRAQMFQTLEWLLSHGFRWNFDLAQSYKDPDLQSLYLEHRERHLDSLLTSIPEPSLAPASKKRL